MKTIISTTLVLLITSITFSTKTKAQCHIDDWNALKALYESTDGDNWTNNTGWDEITGVQPSANCNLENLEGVSLSENGRVYLLQLPYNQLSGSIPSNLGNLSDLISLVLEGNQLNGSIPPDLGNLNNLVELLLEDNQLSERIPSELGNLSNLTGLLLNNNQFIGGIPPQLGNLNKLEYLDLNSNQLNGNIPPELGNLTNLDHLDFNSNQLSGNIPPELGNLTKLKFLFLNSNQLSGSIPKEIGNLINLIQLFLRNNNLSGCYDVNLLNLSVGNNFSVSDGNNFDSTWEAFRYNLNNPGVCSLEKCEDLFDINCKALIALYNGTDGPNWSNAWDLSQPPNEWYGISFDAVGNLTRIELSNNQLFGIIPSELGNLTNLEYLDLSNNHLSGSIPSILGNLSNLISLELSDNQLIGSIPPQLGNLSKLMELVLEGNQLISNIPHELGNLSNLEYLDLSYNYLSSSIPAELGNLNNLTSLGLFGNLLSSSIPAELSNLNKLTSLDLGKNRLTDSIPAELGNLNKLTSLDLPYNQLSGSIPAELSNLNNLTSLDLGINQLSSSIPAELSNLNKLTSLDLYGNQLSGSIPAELSNLNKLTSLDLGDNQLTGSIPAELGNLNNLTSLDLYGNQLSSSIPAELGNLNNLTSLGLYGNQLSSSIPAELSYLNNLTSLDLENNQLTGSILTELGNLNNLTSLDLGNNQLTGSIPTELGNLNNLTKLDLGKNQLSGSIPTELGNLHNLTSVYLGENQLSGIYPPEIFRWCEQLSSTYIFSINNFDVSWNSFCTFGDYAYTNVCNLEDWTALKALYESTNGDNWEIRNGWDMVIDDLDSPPVNCNLRKLYGVQLDSFRVVTLDLGGNQLSGNIPAELGNLNNLTYLDLFYNQLSGSIPAELGNLNNLTILGLNYNQLSGIYPSEIFKWCDQIPYVNIFSENNFDVSWNSFCAFGDYAYANVCNLEDWTALKALYESTNGDNWGNRDGWDMVIDDLDSPPVNCNLRKLYGVQLDSFRVVTLEFRNNQLSGNLPAELGNLNNLTRLDLYYNQLSGSIPAELGNLNNLTNLTLSRNQLSGSIPAELGNLNNLTYLRLNSNQLSGSIPAELDNLNNLTSLVLSSNQLSGNIPSELGNLNGLTYLGLSSNQLSGSIPPELGDLTNLTSLSLSSNQFSGSIPAKLGDLTNLRDLTLAYNQFSGSFPVELGELSSDIFFFDCHNNYFSCGDMSSNLFNFFDISICDPYGTCNDYLPQLFIPTNYGDIKSNVFDTLSVDQSLNIEIDFPFDTAGLSYQWKHNDQDIIGANEATLLINNITPTTAGKYTLKITDSDCLSNGESFIAISDPMYVILKGYDLLGQPVQYDQLVVGFDNAEETEKYEDEILTPNAGIKQKACNCNRELYLWQFPSTEAATRALLEIDKKIHTVQTTNKPRGGFNNIISIGETSNTSIAYKLLSDNLSNFYPDSVSIFILDSGLDEQSYDASSFLNDQDSVDICYGIESSSGYSFIDTTITITTDYQDDLWHGTYGFRSITENLNDNTNIELVPLKIFDKSGQGALFDMICALYYAIDNNADIINISAGFSGQPSYELEKAINLARQKGIFIVAAAGNDSLDIDVSPQYPAYYASQHHKFETSPGVYDSIRYDNVISVSSINIDDKISLFSNYGEQSVTFACYGENIHSYGLGGNDVVASGSSMATYFASKALALEIAENRQRDYQQVWDDFETDWLITNSNLSNITRTGKQIDFAFEEATIEGCTDEANCNYFPFASIDDGSCVPKFINLVDSTNQSTYQYYANDSIVSNRIIKSVDNRLYKAGVLISLENGFTVEKGAEFIVEIENCD